MVKQISFNMKKEDTLFSDSASEDIIEENNGKSTTVRENRIFLYLKKDLLEQIKYIITLENKGNPSSRLTKQEVIYRLIDMGLEALFEDKPHYKRKIWR